MNSWGTSREVEKPKPQVSIASLPEDQQQAAMDDTERASETYPSVALSTGNRLHVCKMRGEWEVWLNTEAGDFDGLCIAVASSRDEAVAQAVKVLESATDTLQGPPW